MSLVSCRTVAFCKHGHQSPGNLLQRRCMSQYCATCVYTACEALVLHRGPSRKWPAKRKIAGSLFSPIIAVPMRGTLPDHRGMFPLIPARLVRLKIGMTEGAHGVKVRGSSCDTRRDGALRDTTDPLPFSILVHTTVSSLEFIFQY